MQKQILVVGSLNMDMVIHMDAMPAVGETVLGDSLAYIPGGKGANQAFAVGKLGGKVSILGMVGKDSSGDELIRSLASANVCVDYIARSDQQHTGTAVIYVNQDGDNSIVVIPGANATLDEKVLLQEDRLFTESSFLMLQMEIPYKTVFHAIRRASELGKKVLLNPAPAPQSLPDDILQKIDYITPNETELAKLTGVQDFSMDGVRSGAKKLIRSGVKNVIVTLGSKGAFWMSEDGTEEYHPVPKVKAIDTTAAGDCFNGAFIVGLAEGCSISSAIDFANRASSIVVTRKGAQSSIPSISEVSV